MTAHHPPDEQLLPYVAGTADDATALLVACHLTLCPSCRDRVAHAEAVGGALLEATTAPAATEGLLEATLARLDDPEPESEVEHDPDGVLPAPLAARVGRFEALPWRWLFPGVHGIELPTEGRGMPVRLLRLAAGGHVPLHEHRGDEITLVLTGGFTDASGHYVRGDVCARDEEGVHEQRIDDGEDCVVLVVADAPFRPRSLKAWVASVTRGF